MPVPEFILKKLIVPGSYKATSTGFSINILNSFASATITRFKMLIGDTVTPDEDIIISSPQQPKITGKEINPSHPLLLPVGTEIIVEVNMPPGNKEVKLTAMTKEVGEITFTLDSKASQHHTKELKPFLFSYFTPIKSANLSVFTGQILGEASPYILGHFIEHLERCVYDGIWTMDGKKVREDTLDLVKQLHPPIIRYPGGNFASGYHWEEGIGSREKRPARHDAAWQAEESNQVGTDEFLSFCAELGSESLLVVNDGSGTPEEAARWVSYCNSSSSTEQGARRAQNGHPEPYNVKYWGIGNEVWGSWQIGTTTAIGYVKRAERFIQAMKAVDPSIKIVAVGHNPLSDDLEDEGALWNEVVLKELGTEIDYLSWHSYQPDQSGWKDNYDALDLYHSICAATFDIEKILNRVDKQIQQFSPNKQILQSVDEWNLWLAPSEKNVSMHHVTYTMRDALYISSVLITFFKHCKSVGMANLAQMVNVLPLIQTNKNAAIATAIFYPFVLFGQMQTTVLHSEIVCETFNSHEQAVNLLAHKNVPYLDGLAAINQENSKLTLLLVNRYPLNRLKVNIHLDKQSKFTPVNAMQIHASAPGAYNSFTDPNQVRISDARLPVHKENELQVTLKPCSVYFVELDINN